MSQKKKVFLINLIAGLAVAVAVFLYGLSMPLSDGRTELQTGDYLRCIADGFTVSAVMLLGVGGIKFVRNKGAFDVLGYGMTTAVHMFLPMMKPHDRLGDREEAFLDYRERKEKTRKGASGELMAGAVHMVLALVFIAVYYLA